jgi:MFS transporter, DHA3 family, tetracycline resistance protein
MTHPPSPQARRALRVYLLLEAASAFIFQLALTLYVVYYATIVGLDALQIVLLGTTFEATIFLFEIPTGIVADVYSRKWSIVAGYALMGAAWLIEGIFPVFGILLVAEIISGIGATFMSGATEAWITDEIGVEAAGHAFVRGAQARTLGSIFGVFASIALGSLHLQLPILATGICLISIAACLAFVMPETRFSPAPTSEHSTWQTFRQTFRQGAQHIRLHPALIVLLGIGFLFGFHSEGFDLLWQKHLLDNFVLAPIGALSPLAWFGIFNLVAQFASLFLQAAIQRRVTFGNVQHLARAVQIIYAFMAFGILAFALTGNLMLALLAFGGIIALRSVAKPLSDAWLNHHFDPQLRATLFSMNNQLSSFGEIVGGTPIGALGRFSLRLALSACGLILALTLPLFRRAHPAE